MAEKILSGVRIVDMSTYIAGPSCAKVLSDWGAEIIKLEGIKGDPVRMLGSSLGMPVKSEENPLYCFVNAGKKSLAIDQRKPECKEVVEKLLSTADVLLTNYRPSALATMGMSYEQLKEKYPKLVFAHVLGYGENGPHSNRPGFDFSAYYARSGFMADLAEKGGAPTSTAAGMGDLQLGMFLVGGIAAALFNRTRTGKGDYVSSSLYHVGIYTFGLVNSAAYYNPTQYPTTRELPVIPSANCYKCKDGEWFMLASASYPIYSEKIFRLVGLDDWADDPEICSIKGMIPCKNEIVNALSEKFLEKTSIEWDEIFAMAEVPAERILHFTDVIKDEQAWANNFLHNMEFANGNSAPLPTTPVKFGSLGEPEFIHPTPVGADNDEIMKKLGFDDAKIAALRSMNVIA